MAAPVEVGLGDGMSVSIGRLRSCPVLSVKYIALGGLPLRMVSQAASRQNVTFVVAQPDLVPAMQRLHYAFFETGANGAVEAGSVERDEAAS
jgi:aspartokinase